MELQSKNQKTSPEQYSSSSHFFKKNQWFLVVGLVGLFFLAINIYLVFNVSHKQPPLQSLSCPINKPATQAPLSKTNNFQDDELGILFQIPKSWGKAIVKNNFSLDQILREITFSNQPNVELVSLTPHWSFPSLLQQLGIATSTDVKSFCENELQPFLNQGEPQVISKKDLFSSNGVYNFGDCAIESPFLNMAEKDESENDISQISFSRNYFWPLQNTIYQALTLEVNIPYHINNSVCTAYAQYLPCLNYEEKNLIEIAFSNFDSSQLSKEVHTLIDSLKIYPADQATLIYENHFKDKALFQDSQLGISFSYPISFGQPNYDSSTRILSFPNDQHGILRIEINTLGDVIKVEQTPTECMAFCPIPLTSSERWKKEKDILAPGYLGSIPCSFEGDYCGITKIGSTKMLVRYYNQWSITDGMRKEYAFYVGDKRFDVVTRSNGVYTQSLAEYQEKEKTDFTLKLFREILESIKVEK